MLVTASQLQQAASLHPDVPSYHVRPGCPGATICSLTTCPRLNLHHHSALMLTCELQELGLTGQDKRQVPGNIPTSTAALKAAPYVPSSSSTQVRGKLDQCEGCCCKQTAQQ